MNKVKLFLLLILLISLNNAVLAQKTEGTLVFKNGDIKEGLVKLAGSKSVKFKATKKEKPITYDFSDLEYAKIKNGDQSSLYTNVVVEGKDDPIVLEEIVKGKVTLYHLDSKGYSPGISVMGGVGGAPMYTGGNFYEIKNLYVLKKGETHAIHLGSNQLFSKNFKAAASEFFKDCTHLVTKIQNKEFKKKEIKAIVEFYNTQCN
tara:strand:+ start:89140 stop:89751 length:612 start_codon:yes stop_codon:yes gene_type:complete